MNNTIKDESEVQRNHQELEHAENPQKSETKTEECSSTVTRMNYRELLSNKEWQE